MALKSIRSPFFFLCCCLDKIHKDKPCYQGNMVTVTADWSILMRQEKNRVWTQSEVTAVITCKAVMTEVLCKPLSCRHLPPVMMNLKPGVKPICAADIFTPEIKEKPFYSKWDFWCALQKCYRYFNISWLKDMMDNSSRYCPQSISMTHTTP